MEDNLVDIFPLESDDDNTHPNNSRAKNKPSSRSKKKTLSEGTPPSPSTEEDSFDALIRDYEKLGSTPPRTRILRRDRSKESRNKTNKPKHKKSTGGHGHERLLNKVINGGRKYINAHLNLIGPWDMEANGDVEPKKRVSKREMRRLRGSERDLKLYIEGENPREPRSEQHISNMKVESSNRFLSLSCKLVKTAIQWRATVPEGGRSRSDFHESFIAMIKSGNGEKEMTCKRTISREEHRWQTELKDMIWLELQAWRADRTTTQQDNYLCEARQSIPQLLDDILNYKFEKKLREAEESTLREAEASVSVDSGIQLSADSEAPCDGCLWLFCPTCIELENSALKEVEALLVRLEHAEALYPSSKAFAHQYPMYLSDEFIGRVKAMCLWYNIMRHHRLKLIILGKQLLSYAKGNVTEQIVFNSESPDEEFHYKWDFYNNTQHLQSLTRYFHHIDSSDTRTYRRFIEDVLKLKGLRKALQFLDSLYFKVLRKGRIAMERPLSEKDREFETPDEHELRRYGLWSEESQSLNLPSFRPAFLFISRIPLDVIHEFLRMRLETKLEKPSSLSIRQLIKELKEGLKLAVVNKQRYLQHCDSALFDEDNEVKHKFKDYIYSFDHSVLSVFQLYLNYTQQWVELTQHERIQKNILEEEWKFVIYTTPQIPGGGCIAGNVFCNIAGSMLKIIASCMQGSITKLNESFAETEDESCLNLQSRQSILHISRELQALVVDTRERTLRVLSLAKTLLKHIESEGFSDCESIGHAGQTLKGSILDVCMTLKSTVLLVQETMLKPFLEEGENSALQCRCREVMHTVYKFTFEYYKEAGKFATNKDEHAQDVIDFSKEWMNFITKYCEKGRGVRPRWANYGLEFLGCITDPKYTSHLSDKEFEALKKEIEACVLHVNGTPTNNSPQSPYLPRSASPSPTVVHNRLSFSALPEFSSSSSECEGNSVSHTTASSSQKIERIIGAIRKLDNGLDEKLKSAALIGNVIVTASSRSNENHLIRPRAVTFPWQRGIKIGQGRFGKVYTAVNTDTGELMAMKEINIQPNDVRTIRKVALEFKIFEGIQHDHLVRYYGAEVHREELLIFMQLCTEGTLEALVEATGTGLPEGLIRRYTSQLLSAITTLHQHSIVHRDIKTANIFLTSEGNCLKLGDFGSAVKIIAHTTLPGELRGFVGTQAYMAPEVFMQTNSSGHGRAVDIWSLGCVVVELSSGKRPWHDYDSNYQIMFKVGMGERPLIPPSLSEEGHNFVSICLRHNPKQRATTAQLNEHTFLKVDNEEECLAYNTPSILEDYLKLGIKR